MSCELERRFANLKTQGSQRKDLAKAFTTEGTESTEVKQLRPVESLGNMRGGHAEMDNNLQIGCAGEIPYEIH